MNDENKAPTVHIPLEHQSAPEPTWADKEVAKAAEEIREGQFTPDLSDDADLIGAIGLVRGADMQRVADRNRELSRAQMTEMADSLALSQHPRVQEALARLEREKKDARTTQEAAEKAQMLHEYNAKAAQKNQWDGQGRWMGKDNEEMRVVNIMTPHQWLAKLESAIGEKRVLINRFAVLKRVAVLVPNSEQNRALILEPGQLAPESQKKDQFLAVGTLQWPCGPEWMIPKFDEYGVPVRAKYLGWRTPLLCLIAKRIITEKEAHKAFPLGDGPAGDWYREQLFELRNRDGVVN